MTITRQEKLIKRCVRLQAWLRVLESQRMTKDVIREIMSVEQELKDLEFVLTRVNRGFKTFQAYGDTTKLIPKIFDVRELRQAG